MFTLSETDSQKEKATETIDKAGKSQLLELQHQIKLQQQPQLTKCEQ